MSVVSSNGSPSPLLQVTNLSKRYASGNSVNVAIERLDFSVAEGEFISIVGPSGCGKTTLLKCMAGLIPVSNGHAAVNGRIVKGPPRELAVVFQDYSRSLFPWYTVAKNVVLPIRKQPAAERAERVRESLDAVGLRGAEDRYPWQLSGGMQQRVAIARALAYRPALLLMDEPFASVDAQTRAELEDLVLGVAQSFSMTIVLVTHDVDEAVYMGDRVIILSPSPCRVQEQLIVDLPRPRNQITTKESTEFNSARRQVYSAIATAREQGANKQIEGGT